MSTKFRSIRHNIRGSAALPAASEVQAEGPAGQEHETFNNRNLRDGTAAQREYARNRFSELFHCLELTLPKDAYELLKNPTATVYVEDIEGTLAPDVKRRFRDLVIRMATVAGRCPHVLSEYLLTDSNYGVYENSRRKFFMLAFRDDSPDLSRCPLKPNTPVIHLIAGIPELSVLLIKTELLSNSFGHDPIPGRERPDSWDFLSTTDGNGVTLREKCMSTLDELQEKSHAFFDKKTGSYLRLS